MLNLNLMTRIQNTFVIIIASLLLNIACNFDSSNTKEEIENIDLESTLISEANIFLNNKLNGKPSKNIESFHPIYLSLNQIRYPDKNQEEVIDFIEAEFYSKEIDKFINEYNLKFNFHEIIDSIHYKNDIIYLFKYTMNGNNKMDTIHDTKTMIAIKKNTSKNWSFVDVIQEWKNEMNQIINDYYSVEVSQKIANLIYSEDDANEIAKLFIPKNLIEEELMNNFLIYFDAFLKGDINKVMNYINPLVFKHLKSVYGEEFSIVDNEMMMQQSMSEMQDMFNDLAFTINIRDILNSTQLNEDIIYIIKYSVDTKIGSMGGIMCATKNKHNGWSFFEIAEKDNELTRQILRIKYSNNEIDKVLNF